MLLVIAGLALVALTAFDVFVTTISMHGGGPVTARLSDRLWRPLARTGRLSHRVLSWYGTAMLPIMVGTWTLLLYVGWTLVFLGYPEAVVNAPTGEPVGAGQRVYFTGYVLTTLGNGELRPGSAAWQACTVATALSGLGLITLAITFATPVINGVVQKRQVAQTITGFGSTAEEVLENAWDGTGFSALTTHLANLVPELTTLAQQHVAYPVLHYFHSEVRATALAPSIAVLDDALTLLRHGVAPRCRIDLVTLGTAATAVGVLLGALEAAHIKSEEASPDAPPLFLLERMGVPTVDHDDYTRALAAMQDRRALLLAFVRSDGWSWEP